MNKINWNIQQDGNDENGGGYKIGGNTTSYSLQANPQVTFDGTTIKLMSSGTSSVMQCTGYTGLVSDSGNIVHVIGGGNATPSWYEIQRVDSSGWYVVDRNWCSGVVTDGAGRMGGALNSVGGMGYILASSGDIRIPGSRAYIKYSSTPYTMISGINIPSGCYYGTVPYTFAFIGYRNNQGEVCDGNDRPLIQTSGNLPRGCFESGLTSGAKSLVVGNIIMNRVFGTTINSFMRDSYIVAYNCKASNSTAHGFYYGDCIKCESSNNAQYGYYGGYAYNCTSHHNTLDGFYAISMVYSCLSYKNGANGFGGSASYIINSTAVDNTTCGFYCSSLAIFCNCLATRNKTYGFRMYEYGPDISYTFINNYTYANSGIATLIDPIDFYGSASGTHNIIELTADPLEDFRNEKYWLNNIAGGGAVLRGAGMKSALSGVVDFPDIGALQHQDEEKIGSIFVSTFMK